MFKKDWSSSLSLFFVDEAVATTTDLTPEVEALDELDDPEEFDDEGDPDEELADEEVEELDELEDVEEDEEDELADELLELLDEPLDDELEAFDGAEPDELGETDELDEADELDELEETDDDEAGEADEPELDATCEPAVETEEVLDEPDAPLLLDAALADDEAAELELDEFPEAEPFETATAALIWFPNTSAGLLPKAK